MPWFFFSFFFFSCPSSHPSHLTPNPCGTTNTEYLSPFRLRLSNRPFPLAVAPRFLSLLPRPAYILLLRLPTDRSRFFTSPLGTPPHFSIPACSRPASPVRQILRHLSIPSSTTFTILDSLRDTSQHQTHAKFTSPHTPTNKHPLAFSFLSWWHTLSA
ncbi:hypothetical protein LY78DRAFT_79254 [Colletotrichum sublineola]|nr:hypothetical protein LY78DRAFT_79254 [Colletotrichum sublineola]